MTMTASPPLYCSLYNYALPNPTISIKRCQPYEQYCHSTSTYVNGTFHLQFAGCWTGSSHTCHGQRACHAVNEPNPLGPFLHCCCEGTLCNRNVTYGPIVDWANITLPSVKEERESGFAFSVWFVIIPVILLLVIGVGFGYFMYRRHKRLFGSVMGGRPKLMRQCSNDKWNSIELETVLSRGRYGCVWLGSVRDYHQVTSVDEGHQGEDGSRNRHQEAARLNIGHQEEDSSRNDNERAAPSVVNQDMIPAARNGHKADKKLDDRMISEAIQKVKAKDQSERLKIDATTSYLLDRQGSKSLHQGTVSTKGHQQVAVKVFTSDQSESWSVEKDILSLPLLRRHGNITRYLGYRVSPECELWLVLEYQRRGSLYDHLIRHTLDWSSALKVISDVMRGLAFLHEDIPSPDVCRYKPTIVHRDIKSHNILLKPDLTAVIADFGLALMFPHDKVLGATHTNAGTYRYMAPEVLQGAINFDSTAFRHIDMYAAALVMWEVVTRCRCDGCYGESVHSNRGDNGHGLCRQDAQVVDDSDSVTGSLPSNHIDTPSNHLQGYKLPFEAELGKNPTFGEMQTAVVNKHIRPLFPPSCCHGDMRLLRETIEECWDHDAEARLSAGCVEGRVTCLIDRCQGSHSNQLMVHSNRSSGHRHQGHTHLNNHAPSNKYSMASNHSNSHSNQTFAHSNHSHGHSNQLIVQTKHAPLHVNKTVVHNNQTSVHSNVKSPIEMDDFWARRKASVISLD